MKKNIKIWLIVLAVLAGLSLVFTVLGCVLGGNLALASRILHYGPESAYWAARYAPFCDWDDWSEDRWDRHWRNWEHEWDRREDKWEREWENRWESGNYSHSQDHHNPYRSGSSCAVSDLQGVNSLSMALSGLEKVRIQVGEGFALYSDWDGQELDNWKNGDVWCIECKRVQSRPTGILTIQIPEEINLDQVKLKFAAGELNADCLASDVLDLEILAGHVQVQNLDCDTANIRMTAGRLDLFGPVRKSANLEVLAGQATLTMPKPEGYSYQLEGVGSITLDGQQFDGLHESQGGPGGDGPEFNVRCVAGETLVEFEDTTQSERGRNNGTEETDQGTQSDDLRSM